MPFSAELVWFLSSTRSLTSSRTPSIVSGPLTVRSTSSIDATRAVCFTLPPARVRALAVVSPVRETSVTPRVPPAATTLPSVSVGASRVTLPLAVAMSPEIDRVPVEARVMSFDVRMALPKMVISPAALMEIAPLLAATASTCRAFCSSMATV